MGYLRGVPQTALLCRASIKYHVLMTLYKLMVKNHLKEIGQRTIHIWWKVLVREIDQQKMKDWEKLHWIYLGNEPGVL